MFYRTTLLLLLAAGTSFGVQAASTDANKETVVYEPTRYYWGLDYISYEGLDYTTNAGARLGYDFTDMFAAEGVVTRSITGSTGISVTLASLFARGNLRLRANNVTVYGLLGVSSVSVTGADGMTDYTYGIGIDMYGSTNTALNLLVSKHVGLDYDQTPGDDNLEFSSFSFGIKHYFDLPALGKRY